MNSINPIQQETDLYHKISIFTPTLDISIPGTTSLYNCSLQVLIHGVPPRAIQDSNRSGEKFLTAPNSTDHRAM